MKKRLLSGLLSLVMVLSMFPSAFAADESDGTTATTYEVTEADDYLEAITTINDCTEGNYIISLQTNIDTSDYGKNVSNNLQLSVQAGVSATLLGNGHTITIKDYTQNSFRLSAAGGTINLGTPDDAVASALFIDGTDASTEGITRSNPIATVGDSGTLNMYSGVKLSNIHTGGIPGGCVHIYDGTFNMYGGEITNSSGTLFGMGGAVCIYDYPTADGTFNMYGGSLTDNSVTDGTSAYGGAVFAGPGGTVNIEGGTISGNEADYGGGICVLGGTLKMSGGVVEENEAESGGGIYLSDATVKLTPIGFQPSVDDFGDGEDIGIGMRSARGGTKPVIRNNNALDGGGGIYATGCDNLQLVGLEITGNAVKSAYHGGGVCLKDCSGALIQDCEIAENSVGNSGYGHGIYVDYSENVQITDCNIHDNRNEMMQNGQGGGLHLQEVSGAVSGTEITNNLAKQGGGAMVYSPSGTHAVTFTDCTITGNEAHNGEGGGLYVSGRNQTVTVDKDSILCNNTADQNGADVTFKSGVLTLPDAAGMNQIYQADGKEQKIDGWYKDEKDDRYQPSPTGVAETLADSMTSPINLVASYKSEPEKIQVTPADIIIYMGGKPYEGAVDGSGTIITNQNAGLPEPGFRVTLPDGLKGTTIADLTFKEKDGNRTWTFQPYDSKAGTDVYKLVPADGQTATRVQFTDPATGNVVPSDEFIVGLEVNKSFTMGLYKGSGETEVGEIVVIEDGVEYAVDSTTGTLTVRGTTKDVSITSVSSTAPTDGKPGAVTDASTTYTINDSEVAVTDGDVSLLFDGIINNEGNDRTGQLEQRAAKALAEKNIVPDANHHFVYELKYLDLVDANNGNAWVKASDDVTIYWPLPEGADTNTLKVLHFKDLHRDMATGQIEEEIAQCEVEIVSSTVSGNYVTFEIGSGGFSPFALVWLESTGGSNPGGGSGTTYYIIDAEAGQGGEISPDGRVRVARGSDKTFTITPDKGYRIADVLVDGRSIGVVSRYTFENVRSDHTIEVIFEKYSNVADPDDTGVSEWLDTSDHRDFLHGYTDGTFGPNRNMTRGEVAQMFYNLLLEQEVSQTTAFTDVPADMWCADAVNTLASLGIVEGIGNGLYAPDRAITRAEFTVIAMRFAKLDTSGENIFSDVNPNDWFYEQVVGSIKYGWIQGYADGTFRPHNTITRAEVTTITNRMLGRAADEAFVDRHSDELRQFPDVPESYWAYYNIMEATNAHDFGMENGAEDWTGLN